jgi:hypothetical protein
MTQGSQAMFSLDLATRPSQQLQLQASFSKVGRVRVRLAAFSIYRLCIDQMYIEVTPSGADAEHAFNRNEYQLLERWCASSLHEA